MRIHTHSCTRAHTLDTHQTHTAELGQPLTGLGLRLSVRKWGRGVLIRDAVDTSEAVAFHRITVLYT